jgi:hypothetical protein
MQGSAAPRKEVWSITLEAFWMALLCCAAIVAFVFLSPRETTIRQDPVPLEVFTIGSTRQQVRAVQGEPTAIEGNAWRYGASTVYFDGNLVVGWRVAPDTPLKVKQPARTR